MPAIEISSLSKYRRNHEYVWRDLSLSIEEGECFGLVGVNGVGKTTLLKVILNLISVNAGTIELFGCSHKQVSARNALAYLPERFTIAFNLTGEAYLRFMLRMYHVEYDAKKVRNALEQLGLSLPDFVQPVKYYSKGTLQKLALACVLLSEKQLLILDEPFSGLDPKARLLALSALEREKERGRTLFISTHMLNDLNQLCHRIGILHEQSFRYVGTPSACCEQFGGASLEEAFVTCIDDAVAV